MVLQDCDCDAVVMWVCKVCALHALPVFVSLWLCDGWCLCESTGWCVTECDCDPVVAMVVHNCSAGHFLGLLALAGYVVSPVSSVWLCLFGQLSLGGGTGLFPFYITSPQFGGLPESWGPPQGSFPEQCTKQSLPSPPPASLRRRVPVEPLPHCGPFTGAFPHPVSTLFHMSLSLPAAHPTVRGFPEYFLFQHSLLRGPTLRSRGL